MRKRRNLCWWLIATWCFPLSGCVAKSVGEGATTFRYEWWLPVGIFVAGAISWRIGLIVRKYFARYGWIMIIGGAGAALVFAPSLLLECVVVDDRGVDSRGGIWGLTANQRVDFDEVTSLRVAQENTNGRVIKWVEVLYFTRKAGPVVRVSLCNDVMIEAGKEIVARAARIGIPLEEFQ